LNFLKIQGSNCIDLGAKLKKREIFKEKGLIARHQTFRGQIEDDHFGLKNDAVQINCSFSPSTKVEENLREKFAKTVSAISNPLTNLTKTKPNHRPDCQPQISQLVQLPLPQDAPLALRKPITNSPIMAGLLVFSSHQTQSKFKTVIIFIHDHHPKKIRMKFLLRFRPIKRRGRERKLER